MKEEKDEDEEKSLDGGSETTGACGSCIDARIDVDFVVDFNKDFNRCREK